MRRSGWIVVLFMLFLVFMAYTGETGIVDWSFIGYEVTPSLVPNNEYDPIQLIETPTSESLFDSVFQSNAQIPTQIIVVQTQAPLPTYTIQPTYTPYPTVAAIATVPLIPVSTLSPEVELIDQYVKVIVPRCMLALIPASLLFVAYLFYAFKLEENRLNARQIEIELETEQTRADTEYLRVQSTIPIPRPIMTNRNVVETTELNNVQSSARADFIVTTDGVEIEKKRLIDFLLEAVKPGGIGLVVSKWKLEKKWEQELIEDILDYLAQLEFITQRQNGRACQWIGNFSVPQILKKIADDQNLMLNNSPAPELNTL